jgi:5-methylcytosine-specific restriction endonuclease McrA
MGMIEECRGLTDADLVKALGFLAHHEKRAVARLLAHLNEFDKRQLCVKVAGRSLFDYCVRELSYDEFDAYRRIRGARTIGKYPIALDLVEDGKLSLTSLVVLHPILTPENYRDWFRRAEGMTRKQLEALVVAKFPEQARPDFVRRLPPPTVVPGVPVLAVDVVPSEAAPVPGAEPIAEWLAIPAPAAPGGRLWQDVSPISAERVRIGFDAATALMRLIERARQVLRHKFPEGRLEDVVREALELLLDRRDPQRRLQLRVAATLGATAALRAQGAGEERDDGRLPTRFLRAYASGRYIPAKVKTAVWARDDGRCAWRFEDGTLCGSRDAVEYDHVIPYAKGGRSEYRNLRLLCRAHNRLAAEIAFPRPSGPPDAAPFSAPAPTGPTAPTATAPTSG